MSTFQTKLHNDDDDDDYGDYGDDDVIGQIQNEVEPKQEIKINFKTIY